MLLKVGTQDANAHPASPCLGTARYEEELERNGQPAGRAQHRAVQLAQNMRQRCHTTKIMIVNLVYQNYGLGLVPKNFEQASNICNSRKLKDVKCSKSNGQF